MNKNSLIVVVVCVLLVGFAATSSADSKRASMIRVMSQRQKLKQHAQVQRMDPKRAAFIKTMAERQKAAQVKQGKI